MEMTPESIADLLDHLAIVPDRIARAVTGWSPEELRAPLDNDGWSAAEILAHLRASDDILAWRLHALLVRDDLPLTSLDERRWAEVAGYAGAKFVSSLTAFRLRRQDLVTSLRRATAADWRRSGLHEDRGRVSLWELATWLAEHEDEHCATLEARVTYGCATAT